MKENISGYSRNPCSLNRERDTAFAAKLLTLPTGFFSAEKSEEWMARSPVWPDDVIASETASRHQPINWRDSIWVQNRSRRGRSRSVKLRSVSFPIQRTRVTRVTRDVFKCYKYINTTFWNVTTVCQFSLFVCAALIDFRKRRSFVWFLLEKLRKPQKFKVLAPWLSPKLSYSFFHIRHLVALNCQKHPSKYLLRMRKMLKIEPSELIFMTDGSFRGCKRIQREVVFSCIYVRGALATDARGCSLWHSLLERPPPGIPGSRPARSKNELGWCGPGGVTHT